MRMLAFTKLKKKKTIFLTQKAHFRLKIITWPGFCHSLLTISLFWLQLVWSVCFNHLYLLPLGKIGIYYRQGALQNYHTGPGLHTMAPWITKVEQVTIRSQTETMPRYGNTGCGVSDWGIQNPLDFCLKVKWSKGFLDTFPF